MSEFVEGRRRGSGEAAATEASLERKGSRGFKGGIGIDLQLLLGEDMEEAIGIVTLQEHRNPMLPHAISSSSSSLSADDLFTSFDSSFFGAFGCMIYWIKSIGLRNQWAVGLGGPNP